MLVLYRAYINSSPIFTDHSEALVTCEKIIAETMEGAIHALQHLGSASVREQQQSEDGK